MKKKKGNKKAKSKNINGKESRPKKMLFWSVGMEDFEKVKLPGRR